MNTFTKLTALAITAAGIAGGVAVAQDTSSANTKDKYTNSDTANYGTPPGAPLKRDGSLRADPTAPAVTDSAAVDSSSTTTTTTSTTSWNADQAAAPAPVAAAPAADTSSDTTSTADATPAPRADRN